MADGVRPFTILPGTPVRFVEHQWLLGQKAALRAGALGQRRVVPGLEGALGTVPTAMGQVAVTQQAFGRSKEISGAFSRTGGFVGAFGESLGAGVSSILSGRPIAGAPSPPLGGSAWNFIRKLPEVWGIGGAFRGALGLAAGELMRAFEEARLGDEVLREADFGFSDVLWTIAYRRTLARTNAAPNSKNAQAAVTNRLLAVTRSEWFVEDVAETFASSSLLAKRWRVVGSAIGAHASRDYALSIPVLMAQVEGALADAMMLKDLVVKEGNAYYLVGEDGGPKRGKKDRRLPPVTLGAVRSNADLREGTELGAAAEFIANSLVQRRNEVLHGRDVGYARAKLSVQALLVLTVVAEAVARLEEG